MNLLGRFHRLSVSSAPAQQTISYVMTGKHFRQLQGKQTNDQCLSASRNMSRLWTRIPAPPLMSRKKQNRKEKKKQKTKPSSCKG